MPAGRPAVFRFMAIIIKNIRLAVLDGEVAVPCTRNPL